VTLLAFAAAAPLPPGVCCQPAVLQSIDIACQPGAQQQTRRTTRLRRKMGQTDGRTLYR